ncbi:hypothetical protein PUN28_017191 [Cardiocondyla obscurior]|uniref:Uncharacterized protein n=1 Tax=Cardiocondyla obscurior TaxID=286306 RepID=A0AAW2EPH9_9HYME
MRRHARTREFCVPFYGHCLAKVVRSAPTYTRYAKRFLRHAISWRNRKTILFDGDRDSASSKRAIRRGEDRSARDATTFR